MCIRDSYLKSGKYDVRFLGEDYVEGNYTGFDIPIDVVFLDRKHRYSTTQLKIKIANYLN